jgi:hypothetical protein
VEELYDTEKDPDNVVNLAHRPGYRKVLATMRSELRSRQLRIHDSALMPESERVRRAEKHGCTIYEMVRDRDLYNLPAYLDAADAALAGEKADQKRLIMMLRHDDCAIRYWGVVGLFLLEEKSGEVLGALKKALGDASDEVRAMAAWALIRCGRKKEGRQCLLAMLKRRSYASLTILNIIDWVDDDKKVYLPALGELTLTGYEKRMKTYLLKQYG